MVSGAKHRVKARVDGRPVDVIQGHGSDPDAYEAQVTLAAFDRRLRRLLRGLV